MAEELSELEKIRMESMKFLDDFWEKEMADPENAAAINAVSILNKTKKSAVLKPRNSGKDVSIHFNIKIPTERRWSSRKRSIPPEFSYNDLPDEDVKTTAKRSNIDKDNFDEIEQIFYKPVKMRMSSTKRTNVPFVAVEDITDAYISKIAFRGTVKKYSDDGTSCHQCRQKTLDSKTYCRSGRCIGVRGQFCGTCLLNRYGENAAIVLRDPKWVCPPCRDMCNCSICRARKGKRATGILAPIAQAQGYNSVKDFLISLNGYGDFIALPTFDKNLLGFDTDHNAVISSNISGLGMDLLGFIDERAVYKIPNSSNPNLIVNNLKMKLETNYEIFEKLLSPETWQQFSEQYLDFANTIGFDFNKVAEELVDL